MLLIEGFEQYGADVQLARGGWSSNLISAWNPLSGAGEPRHAGGKCVEGVANGGSLVHGVTPSVDFTCGFAYFLADAAPDNTVVIVFRNNAIQHLRLRITAAGELALDRGVTQLAITSGQGLTQSIWYYIEVNARIDNSGDYDVHIDGSQVFQATGVDTQNGGSAVVDNIFLQGDATLDPRFDDIYFLDDTGTDNVGLLGDCRVETVFPDALGNENDFTASPAVGQHLNVDDGLTPDDDTTYNHSATVTDRELYGFAALTGDIDTVFAVDGKMLVRKEDAGFREVRVISRSNVTEVESADKTLGVDYVYVNHIFENDPNGGGNWTETAVNAAQFGLDLQT